MGLTHLILDVANVTDPARSERLKFLIDTGASYSVVPKEVLQRLGIQPFEQEEFVLANGESITRSKGGAVFRYDGRSGFSSVIFGEEGDSILLGVTTLEEMGLSVDPIRRKLLHLPSLM